MSHHPAAAQRLSIAERYPYIEELTPGRPRLATQSIRASHVAEINDDHVWRVLVADSRRAKEIDSKIGMHFADAYRGVELMHRRAGDAHVNLARAQIDIHVSELAFQ